MDISGLNSSFLTGGTLILALVFYIAIMALAIWIGYIITKTSIKNAINDSELGKYFSNLDAEETWLDKKDNEI